MYIQSSIPVNISSDFPHPCQWIAKFQRRRRKNLWNINCDDLILCEERIEIELYFAVFKKMTGYWLPWKCPQKQPNICIWHDQLLVYEKFEASETIEWSENNSTDLVCSTSHLELVLLDCCWLTSSSGKGNLPFIAIATAWCLYYCSSSELTKYVWHAVSIP